MKSILIKYTDFEIKRIITEQLLSMNREWLKLGDPMSGPHGHFRDGRVFDSSLEVKAPPNFIKLNTFNDCVPDPEPLSPLRSITATTATLMMADIEKFRPSLRNGLDLKLSSPTFLHPFVVTVPSREWLEQYDVGDEVTVAKLDAHTFDHRMVSFKLTQEIIDTNSFVHFRFGLS